uniref:DUF5753 domain-containing protein n=1 Tax=Steinernema glaseri TaxID=37863 RepID=A0A1I8A506_9BILA
MTTTAVKHRVAHELMITSNRSVAITLVPGVRLEAVAHSPCARAMAEHASVRSPAEFAHAHSALLPTFSMVVSAGSWGARGRRAEYPLNRMAAYRTTDACVMIDIVAFHKYIRIGPPERTCVTSSSATRAWRMNQNVMSE